MNSTNPLKPTSSMLEEKNKSRSRVRLVVFAVLAFHVVVLVPLLVQGCKREEAPPSPVVETNLAPVEETNLPPVDAHPSVVVPQIVFPPTSAAPVVPEATLPAASGTEYTVVKGDSFYVIGKRHGVSMKAIADANPGVDSSHLKIGQKLNIPAGAAPSAASATVGESVSGEAPYTVKSGDTLIRIARQHGTSVKSIKAANNLTTDKIKVGQKLKIPGSPAAAAPIPAAEPAPAPVLSLPAPTTIK